MDMNWMDNAVANAVYILDHYPGPVTLVAALTSSAIVAYWVSQWVKNHKPKDTDAEMKRRQLLDQKYADGFGDILFDMLMKDEITRHEYRRDCRRFGIAYRLSDLLVKKNPKRGLKYRVQKNCADIHRTPPLAGKSVGPSPRNDRPVVAVVSKRKIWVARLTRKSA